MKSFSYLLALVLIMIIHGCGGCEQTSQYTGDPNPLYELHKVYGRVKTLKTEYFDVMIKEGKYFPGSHVGDNITVDTISPEGKLIASRVYAVGGGLTKSDVFRYNEKGDIIAIQTVNPAGISTTDQTITYNEAGQKIKQEVVMHLAEGDQSFWRSWVFDDKGQMTESYVYRLDSVLDSRETLTYYAEDSGKIHQHSLFVGMDSLKYRNEYLYYSDGKDSVMMRYRQLEDGQIGLHSYYTYTYDDKGNEIAKTLTAADGRVLAKVTYQYEYDDHANWTHKYEIIDGEPSSVKVRTFTYYE